MNKDNPLICIGQAHLYFCLTLHSFSSFYLPWCNINKRVKKEEEEEEEEKEEEEKERKKEEERSVDRVE